VVSKDGKASAGDWPWIAKQLDAGFDIVTFDFRGLGETRMPYKAVSEDDPSLAQLDFDRAYVNPLSGVLADYVYNSLLTGRPYFLQMIEDTEIAARFSGRNCMQTTFLSRAKVTARFWRMRSLKRCHWSNFPLNPGWKSFDGLILCLQRRELWPIQYLLPGGAYIH